MREFQLVTLPITNAPSVILRVFVLEALYPMKSGIDYFGLLKGMMGVVFRSDGEEKTWLYCKGAQ